MVESIQQISDYIKGVVKLNGVMTFDDKKKADLNKARFLLMNWLSPEEEFLALDKAFEILSKNGKESDIQSVIQEFEKISINLPNPEIKSDCIQHVLNFSDDSYHKIYALACELSKKHSGQDASALFVLLTRLNPYLFEPWLFYGLNLELDRQFFPAVCIYAMASLIDFAHPAPHLHTAGIYLQAGKQELAQQTLEYCLGNITPEGRREYKSLVDDLRRQIYSKKWAKNLMGSVHAAEEKALKMSA